MKELTIKPRENVKTLKVNIGDDSYQIPLASSMSMKDARLVETQAGTYAYICKFIPREVLEELMVDDYNNIVNTWMKESGVTPKKLGES